MKIKKLGIALLSLFLIGGVAFGATSCGQQENGSTSTVENGGVNFAYVEGTKFVLNGISLDTTTVQKKFYVGDAFNSDNLIVTREFNRVTDDVDMRVKELNLRDTTTFYSVDTSEVDMNHVGEYLVYVRVRYGSVTRTDNYKIQVLTSKFETTPNLEYAAGLSVTYSDDTKIKKYYVDDNIDTASLTSGLKIKLNKKRVNSDGSVAEDLTPESLTASQVTIDSSNVKNNEVGTYMIKVSYKSADLTVDGEVVPNEVTSYVLVDVTNPVVSISKESSGDTDFNAVFGDLDFSEWIIKITRQKRAPEFVNFSYDIFDVSGVSPFVAGEQTAALTLKEDPTKTLSIKIKIKESKEYNIIQGKDLSRDLDGTQISDVVEDKVYTQLDSSALFFAKDVKRDPSKNSKADGLSFTTRISLQGGIFDVVLGKEGTIIIYATSTASSTSAQEDLERVITVQRLNDNGEIDEEFEAQELTTSVGWASGCTTNRLVVTLSQAGTYRFTGKVYICGAVVATKK